MDFYYVHFQNGYDSYTDPTSLEAVFVADRSFQHQGH